MTVTKKTGNTSGSKFVISANLCPHQIVLFYFPCLNAQRKGVDLLARVRDPFEGERSGELILGVILWIQIVGFFILMKSMCCILFISTYKGLIAIRHVGGITGREQEMEYV